MLRIVGAFLVVLGLVLAGLALRGRDQGPAQTPSPDLPAVSASPSERRTPQPPIDRSEIHVDGRATDPDARGTEDDPLPTIQGALNLAGDRSEAGLPTTVVVAAGTYREELELSPADDAITSGTIVLRGVDVIVSGADRRNATQRPDGLWELPWDEAWGPSPFPDGWEGSIADGHLRDQPLLLRRELVVADGVRLDPRNRLDEVLDAPGTFAVLDDQAIIVANTPDAGPDSFEVGKRETLLKIDGRRGVTVQGLSFRHAPTRVQRRAVTVLGSDDITFEDVDASENSWFGLGMTDSREITLRRVTADRNGGGGLTAFEVDDLLVEDSSTSRNSWRTAISAPGTRGDHVIDLGVPDFASGQKFFRLRGALFLRHTAVDNATNGLWFDFDNVDVVLEDSEIRDNGTQGLFIEANQGPVAIRSSRICGNEVGILVSNSEDLTIRDSILGDNVISQVYVAGQVQRGIATRDGEELVLTTTRLALAGNTMVATSGQRLLMTRLSDQGWRDVLGTTSATANTYVQAADTPGFLLPEDEDADLARWQEATGLDADSATAPFTTACPER